MVIIDMEVWKVEALSVSDNSASYMSTTGQLFMAVTNLYRIILLAD